MFALVARTIRYFYYQLFPVVLGVAVAGAVIVGALVVGDSVRGSLRHIAMDRIGKIDHVLLAPRWFSPDLLDSSELKRKAHPVVFIQQASALHDVREPDLRTVHRANDMTLFGVDSSFWDLEQNEAIRELGFSHPVGEEVVLNQTLASELQVVVGELITLRVSAEALVPAESALGKRELDSFVLPRWRVVAILPDEGLARFSLRSDQRPTMNAFVDLASIQSAIEIGNRINAYFTESTSTTNSELALLTSLKATPADLGLQWESVFVPASEELHASIRYDHLTTDQMLISDSLASRIMDTTARFHPQRVLTYLANGVEKSAETDPKQNVPYSTISASEWSLVRRLLVESDPELDSLPRDEHDLTGADVPWVVVNQWLAKELGIQVGDRLKIDYFLPETVEGREVEKSFEAQVIAVAPLSEPSIPYRRNAAAQFSDIATPFNDPHWTPIVPGITDQDSISKWDTPFPLKRSIESRDDAYWNNHRLTPKLFVSYDFGKETFGSRFGNVTSIRYDNLDDGQRRELERILTVAAQSEMPSMGWREIPLRQQQIARSSGTTPFDGLFLALSFFLIAAALLLVALLFRLSIERRANHWGVFSAIGWNRKRVRRLLLLEGAFLSALGATIGVVIGTYYAYGIIELLSSWWVGATTVSFLEMHLTARSWLIGWIGTFVAAMLSIFLSARKIEKSSITSLLKGRVEEPSFESRPPKRMRYIVWVALIAGVGLLWSGRAMQGQAQAGAFVGAGMLFLISGLALVWQRLRTLNRGWGEAPNVISLASSTARRAPSRSILAIALVAVASFLILSMSLFQASPTEVGMGGFQWIGKSTSPIYVELGNAESRREGIGGAGREWEDIEIVSLRVRGGDDASCNNLYQADEPQIFGVSPRMAEIDQDARGRSRFAWFQRTQKDAESPWASLEHSGDGSSEAPIPVVLDQNTALWALHLGGYVGEVFHFEFDNQRVHFRTVGVLQNTILQGGLLIGEKNFQRLFPSLTGYRSFLVHIPESKISESSQFKGLLEGGWEEQGLSFLESRKVLEQLLAVQNTYLSAFQLLGSLGLLLGTIGLSVTQIRSALERRAELGTLRAIGFSKRRLTWILALENVWQLLRGILIGGGAAILATIPSLLSGQPFSGVAGPLGMIAVILLVGGLSSWLAAKIAMRWPLLDSLRTP